MEDMIVFAGALGAVLGLAHGYWIYRQVSARHSTGAGLSGRARGVYYALWTLALWTVFGTYVLAFWILGSVCYPVVQLLVGGKPLDPRLENMEAMR